MDKRVQQDFEDLLDEGNDILDDRNSVKEIYDFRLVELNLQERQEFLDFRKRWSKILLMLVIFIVIFNAAFLVAVGNGKLLYHDEWLVRIIVGGSFIEVLALAKIIVEFLFNKNK